MPVSGRAARGGHRAPGAAGRRAAPESRRDPAGAARPRRRSRSGPTPTGATTRVGAPTVRSRSVPSPARAPGSRHRGRRRRMHDAVSIAIVGAKHLTLLAFLTSGCSTCLDFWDAFAAGEPRRSRATRASCWSRRAPMRRAPASVRKLARRHHRAAGDVVGCVGRVRRARRAVLRARRRRLGQRASAKVPRATGRRSRRCCSRRSTTPGSSTARAGGRRGRACKFRSDAVREARADRDLMAAGIRPGDPSLYPETVEDVDPYGPPS